MAEKQKIIYSLRAMEKLVAMGYIPIGTLPNPTKPEFMCWIFEVTPEFQRDVDIVLGGISHG